MKNTFTLACIPTLLFLCLLKTAVAQPNQSTRQPGNMNIGHFFGKVLDSKTNKPIELATVQLTGNRFDTGAKKMTTAILKTVLTEANGDFSLENVPVFGNFTLKISSVGYKPSSQQITFGLKPQNNDNGNQQDRMQQMMNMVDKDLGNIKLDQDETTLSGVTVTTAAKPFFEMGVDRKVFNVDKNIVSQGQTATEVMKQIPGINVDIDGNVTLRNSAPQLFIDGRPTTLTFDQIPSDLIDKVELITNPSAKFDASGGNAGIVNIVLKKNKRTGYNGGIRAGIDSRGRPNIGGDINFRQNKLNFFLSGNYNQRKSISTFNNSRYNISDTPSTITQDGKSINTGYFAFLRSGFDYFIDNRNTLTLTGTYVHGHFNNDQSQLVDSTIQDVLTSYSNSYNNSKFDFENFGGQLSFRHNFTKENNDITADINYNSSVNHSVNNISTYTFEPGTTNYKVPPFLQQITSDGSNRFLTMQSDYENQLNDKTKIEAGVRSALRYYKNINNQFYFNESLDDYVFIPQISSNYKYTDQVYAGYATYTMKLKKWNFQFGLRGESSNYDGTLLNKDSAFKISYAISFFPSSFITYHIDAKQDFQINYSRRINRPNFFQLIPFYDYSDPQNPSVGNAALRPEFTNAFELSYNNAYKKGANFLMSAYFKYSTDLITRFQYKALNGSTPEPTDSVVFNTFANANNSIIYGLELTNRITLVKIWDMTANLNLYNAKINGDNLGQGFTSERISWFAKMNNTFKLAKGFNIQLSGNYQAKTVLPASSGSASGGGGGGRGGGGFGGGGFGGGFIGTAQGYIFPRYSADMAIQKTFTWKGGNTLSLTLSMNDIFATERYRSYVESIYFTQTSERRRDPHILRLNVNYRFGKFDVSLFKRKNNNQDQNSTEMMGGQQ
jgi:outer membrane receptor protein involved in Fe transport